MNTTTQRPRYAPEWLALREPADAAARSAELLVPLREFLAPSRSTPEDGDGPDGDVGDGDGDPVARDDQASAKDDHASKDAQAPGSGHGSGSAHAPQVIRDLGCGTGSMGRWLAPRLPGPQHWILHDHDPDLLHRAASGTPRAAADGSHITVSTERGDIAQLGTDGLAGTSLVTASALLDLLTLEELDGLAAACARARCPALLALSVVGRVELVPGDPLDAVVSDAFNAHQRRVEQDRRLLGPDAVTAAAEAFGRHGMTVRLHTSPWRLGADRSALTAQWLRGWVGAAREQRPALAQRADTYLRRRLAACKAGGLGAVVHHTDLLALPGPPPKGGDPR